MARTPEQIIGKDALTQLAFEGYAVVPATARIEIVAAWWRQKNTGDDPSDYAAYKAMIEVAETVT